MPAVNEYVNYGCQGICKIEDLRFMKFGSVGHDYFVLKPVHQENASIFVPADNQNLLARMRPILAPEEIDQIIASVKDQDMLWISDRKARAAQFQAVLSRRDERELLLLVSCLYLKSQENPKGLSSTDAQILQQAEHIIEQEFSFALQISPQDIGSYIRKRLGIVEPAKS